MPQPQTGAAAKMPPPNDHGSPRRCHNHDVPHPRLSMPPHTRHRLQRYAAQPKAGQPRCRNLKQGYSGPPRCRDPQCAAPQQPPRLPRPTSPSDDAQPTKPPPPNTAKYPLNPASGDNAAQHRYRGPVGGTSSIRGRARTTAGPAQNESRTHQVRLSFIPYDPITSQAAERRRFRSNRPVRAPRKG